MVGVLVAAMLSVWHVVVVVVEVLVLPTEAAFRGLAVVPTPVVVVQQPDPYYPVGMPFSSGRRWWQGPTLAMQLGPQTKWRRWLCHEHQENRWKIIIFSVNLYKFHKRLPDNNINCFPDKNDVHLVIIIIKIVYNMFKFGCKMMSSMLIVSNTNQWTKIARP